jgi:hypothetical protein
MFEQNVTPQVVPEPAPAAVSNKYKNIIQPFSGSNTTVENTYGAIDQLLEREKLHNKSESWNKLDKTVKIQKLHQFAEKYGCEHAYPVKEIKALKAFFVSCMDKNKLQKTKEVIYDKDSRQITSIPALHFNVGTNSFTLKNMDAKRVSTIKSLTPKRVSERNLQDNALEPSTGSK